MQRSAVRQPRFLCRRRPWIPGLVVAWLGLGWVEAAVFTRIPKTPRGVFEQLGGQVFQETALTVNGTPGTLQVMAFDQSAQSVCGALAAVLERPGLAQAGAGGALWFEWPVGREPRSQVLVLSAGTSDRALAMVIDVPDAARRSPAVWPWHDLSPPGGFQPSFSVEPADGTSALVTGTLPGAPEGARRMWTEHLTAQGWAAATPAAEVVSTALYARNEEVLAVTVLAPDETAPGARVLLLRRRPR